jgi:hypothetical protein
MTEYGPPKIGGCDTLMNFGDLQQVASSKPFSMVTFANNNIQCRIEKLTKGKDPQELLFIPPAVLDLVVSPVADLLAGPARIAKDAGITPPTKR